MSNYSPTIVAASLSDQDLKDSIDKLVKKVDDGTKQMKTSFDTAIDHIKNRLKELGDVSVNISASETEKATRRKKEETQATKEQTQAVKEQNATYDQMSNTIKKISDDSHRYSEEVRKQAQAIRATEDWQRRGAVTIGDFNYYDKDRANVSRRDKALLLTLEEQIIEAQNKQAKVSREVAEEIKRQAEAQKEVEQAALGTARIYGTVLDQQKKSYEVLAMQKVGAGGFKNYIDLRDAISASLGVSRGDVKVVDERTDSVSRLTKSLKQLKTAYQYLNEQERSSDNGKALLARIQAIERGIQKVQERASAPVSLGKALGLEERTLNDIVYKMKMLQSYRQNMDISNPNNLKTKKELDEIAAALDRLRKKQTEIMGSNKSLLDSNNALARSWNYMKNRLAFYFTVGASTQFVKNLIDVRSQYEMNERALGILINSAEHGTQIFQELSNMALVSPYTLIELSSAAKQLTAYDIAAKDVVDTTRRLADMASAVGVPIERLTYALGQIKAYGYLNSRDARMFANAGIPLVKQLADYYTELEGKMVSTADVYDRMKKKAIGYNDVMQVINKMTDEGGKFFDFQAKMADTLKVKLANLTLAWNNMLNEIGASNQGILTSGIGLLKDVFANWKTYDKIIADLAISFGIAKAAQLVYYGVTLNTNKAIAIQTVLGTKLTTVLKTLGMTMNKVLTSGTTWWGLLATAVLGAVISISRGNEVMKELNASLRENAKSTFEDISKFLDNKDYAKVRKQIGEGSASEDDTIKLWENVREQIELSSRAGSEFVSKLLDIQDVSKRVQAGFELLEDIRTVTAALKELGDNGIKVERDMSEWWNLWTFPDGLIGNLKDTHMWLSKINAEFGSMENAKVLSQLDNLAMENGNTVKNLFKDKAGAYIENYEEELEKFRKDLATTTESVINFINLKGWQKDTTKIEEVFNRVLQTTAEKNALSPEEFLSLRLESAEAERRALANAIYLQSKTELEEFHRVSDEKQKIEHERRFNELNEEHKFLMNNTAQSRVYWEDFLKWLGAEHKSEVQHMFSGMSAEQIKSLDWMKGGYYDWVRELVDKYEKEHGFAFGSVFLQLKNYINDANRMSIRIPLIITSEEVKGVYETLAEQDKLADAAYQKIQRLKRRETDLINQGKKDSEEYTKTVAARVAAEKDLAKAESEGGHSKKEDAAGKKAQKAAESELQKALKEEITLLDKVRSVYKSLTKEGVSSTEALNVATNGYDKTLKSVNAVLSKYGLSELDLTKYAGVQNPKAVMDMLQEQLNQLVKSGVVKPEEIKDLEVKLKDLKVDSVTFSQKTLVDSLNNELGKLKDEYELAIDLDANPELGETFADVIGINKEELDKLPKDFESVVTKMQAVLDEKLGSGVFDVKRNLNKKNLESWLTGYGYTADSQMAKELTSYVDYANKVRQDETNKQVDEWNKLLEKYAEYEYKRKQITDTYEREIATAVKKNASEAIIKGIKNKRDQDLAKLDFDEFMKSPQWITATGDLASLSDKAIRGLIKTLEDYKKSAKNLSPKQIKQINNALKNLYKEQRKGSPFKAISNMMEEARNKMKEYDEEIKKTEKEMNELGRIKVTDGLSEEQETKLKSLRKRWNELKKAQQEAGDIDASQWVGAINETITAVQGAVSVFGDLAKAIQGVDSDDVDKVFGVLSKAGSGAAIGALAGGWGALAGAVLGAASGIVEWISGAANEKINAKVRDSELAVKRLENTYKHLEYAIEDAYGTAIIGAQKAAVANKELQLVELKRQLTLEQGRDSKDRDESRIEELRGEIIELERSIKEATDDIVNGLLGISSVSDAIEDFMDAYVEAIRNGEDANKVFSDSINDMVANMVKKMLSTKIIAPWFEKTWNTIQEEINARGEQSAKAYENAKYKYETAKDAEGGSLDDLVNALRTLGLSDEEIHNLIQKADGATVSERLMNVYKQELEKAKKEVEDTEKQLSADTSITVDDIRKYAELLRSGEPIMDENMKAIEELLKELGLINDDLENSGLSALQQGIQGITEDTAGAIEAYMNIVSQRVFYHGTLLEQIRDAVTGLNTDMQLGVFSQMLLQLQDSYRIQMAIRDILSGWSNPSGLALRVEMV